MMKKITLPNGLQVAPVALGAMNFGTTTSKEQAYDVLDAYVDFGGNFIDTSNNYAHWAGTGDESETVLGQWLRDRGCRDRVVIATKVGFDRHGEGAGLKKEQIEYWIDESLRKLGTDYIDLYYAHTDDMNTPIEETMQALHDIVKSGKALYIGISNYGEKEAEIAIQTLQKMGTHMLIHQPNYSMPTAIWRADFWTFSKGRASGASRSHPLPAACWQGGI